MIAIIAGLTKERVIGKDGGLPWNIPSDLKNFRKITSGGTVIMGWKTWTSIGRPLPKRKNIVISNKPVSLEGVDVVGSLNEGIKLAKTFGNPIFLIGGASVYSEGLTVADTMYLSWIHKNYPGDVYFPEFDSSLWKEVSKEEFDEFTCVCYERS